VDFHHIGQAAAHLCFVYPRQRLKSFLCAIQIGAENIAANIALGNGLQLLGAHTLQIAFDFHLLHRKIR